MFDDDDDENENEEGGVATSRSLFGHDGDGDDASPVKKPVNRSLFDEEGGTRKVKTRSYKKRKSIKKNKKTKTRKSKKIRKARKNKSRYFIFIVVVIFIISHITYYLLRCRIHFHKVYTAFLQTCID